MINIMLCTRNPVRYLRVTSADADTTAEPGTRKYVVMLYPACYIIINGCHLAHKSRATRVFYRLLYYIPLQTVRRAPIMTLYILRILTHQIPTTRVYFSHKYVFINLKFISIDLNNNAI